MATTSASRRAGASCRPVALARLVLAASASRLAARNDRTDALRPSVGCVVARVLAAQHHLEVFDAVVVYDGVLVMNMLDRIKDAPQGHLHDDPRARAIAPPPVDLDSPIGTDLAALPALGNGPSPAVRLAHLLRARRDFGRIFPPGVGIRQLRRAAVFSRALTSGHACILPPRYLLTRT